MSFWIQTCPPQWSSLLIFGGGDRRMAGVMIGIDPHKGSHTAVAIDEDETSLGRVRVRACERQAVGLMQWAYRWPQRTWAVEGARGLGQLLAQQLIAAGECVVDVPPKLGARVRLLDSGQINKTDENDARSVAVAALRAHNLAPVAGEDQTSVMRLWARRYHDLGRQRTQATCRLHTVLRELVPGGARNHLRVSHALELIESIAADSPVTQAKLDLARDLLADLQRIDTQRRTARQRAQRAVAAAHTTITEIHGVGPIVAGTVLGYVRDIRRFPTPHHFASYNGTAPIEVSSGDRKIYRLSHRGNRHLNHAIHMAAVTQIGHPGSEGRAYYQRKRAQGMTTKSALRALKRKISDTLYQRMLDDARHQASKDPGGQAGNDAVSSAAGSHPNTPALRKSHSRAAPNSKTTTTSRQQLTPRHAPDRREPAGAQPASRWSPANARAAGGGRNDLDPGEHRPQSTRRSRPRTT